VPGEIHASAPGDCLSHIESAKWAQALIRARVDELEEIYGRLISCRVRVDQRAKNSAGTIPPVVRIELGIPGHKAGRQSRTRTPRTQISTARFAQRDP
jgi:hypothetical protein